MLADFQATYHAIDLIDNKSVWQKYIYQSKELEDIDTVLDCSFLCKNVERKNNCDLFAFEDQICYLGKSSFAEGTVELDLMDITIYLTEGNITDIFYLPNGEGAGGLPPLKTALKARAV